jgi:hypothetical protein
VEVVLAVERTPVCAAAPEPTATRAEMPRPELLALRGVLVTQHLIQQLATFRVVVDGGPAVAVAQKAAVIEQRARSGVGEFSLKEAREGFDPGEGRRVALGRAPARDAELVAHIVTQRSPVVTRKRVHNEAIGSSRVDQNRKRVVLAAVTRTGSADAVPVGAPAKQASDGPWVEGEAGARVIHAASPGSRVERDRPRSVPAPA